MNARADSGSLVVRVTCAIGVASLGLVLARISVRAQTPPAPSVHAARSGLALLLADDFNGVASPGAGHFGLGAMLAERQRGSLAPATYTLLPGVWHAAPPAAESTAVVDAQATDGTANHLALRGFTAVQLDAPIALGAHGAIEVHATLDPVVGDTASEGWLSIVIARHRRALGWVTDANNVLGLLVRSNGQIGVSAHGTNPAIRWAGAQPVAAASYAVSLVVRWVASQSGRELRLEGTINGASFTSVLANGAGSEIPASVLMDIGAHFHPGDAQVSTVDDLELFGARGVMPPDAPPAPPPEQGAPPVEPDLGQGVQTEPQIARPR